MIRSGSDFWAELSTGRWAVIISDNMGVMLPQKSIVVYPKGINTYEYANTLCHEVLHASMQRLSEKEVRRVSHDIAQVLWKRGYRLPNKRKKITRHTKG